MALPNVAVDIVVIDVVVGGCGVGAAVAAVVGGVVRWLSLRNANLCDDHLPSKPSLASKSDEEETCKTSPLPSTNLQASTDGAPSETKAKC